MASQRLHLRIELNNRIVWVLSPLRCMLVWVSVETSYRASTHRNPTVGISLVSERRSMSPLITDWGPSIDSIIHLSTTLIHSCRTHQAQFQTQLSWPEIQGAWILLHDYFCITSHNKSQINHIKNFRASIK